jgi:thiamine kinase-like enzyme
VDGVFPIILAHNDAQENNILIKFSDNRKLLIIDYEYAGWNPMAIDLSNYINETMLDNSYPDKNGIAWYLENCMSPHEVEMMTR